VLGRGSSLRELNDAVFDAMVKGKGGIVRVGAGSGIYSFVGRWVPRGLVGWMMGLRKVDSQYEFGKRIGGSEMGSRSASPGSNSSIGVAGDNVHRSNLGDSEYVYDVEQENLESGE
jgi:hypothetical protein